MEILNIIDKIYESKYFTTVLISAVIVLAVLFIAVLILGLKDAKKLKNPKKNKEEDIKDITFNAQELDSIKEDVTFEIPALTKNLEDFKRSLEEEIQKEENDIIVKQNKREEEPEIKPVKILEINEIEDTSILDLTNDKTE